jgi:prolyl oligopeptidase
VGQNAFHKVYLHKVGTPQASDELIFEDKAHPLRYHNVGLSTDERFAVLSVEDPSTGKKGNNLYYFDMKSKSKKFLPIVDQISEDRFSLVDNVGDVLLIQSNLGAPLGKVIAFETSTGKFRDKPVIAETKDSLSGAWTAGGRLFLSYSKDVADHLYQHRLDGTFEAKLKLPGIGTVGVGPGQADDKDLFYVFTNLNSPATIYRYSIASRESEVFEQPQIPGYDPKLHETKQVFYASKDGTKIPMSMIYKKGLVLNGKNPTLLYAYGGFNISSVPYFNSLRLALLEQGFVYAVANIRGGGEYGENWHEQGTKLKKQNVFDDFIAAAEWLISNKYTSSEKLAINGGSNGGLLVGAVINQRPDLYRAAVPQVGVMDMLRFHKFTIGSGWIGDYGSSDNEEEFKALFAYSPLHNIKPQVRYPSVLVTSADHDDRVVPAHSFKYAAAMQEKVSKERPVLIRIGTNSGHGASSLGKAMEETADVYCFLMKELGVEPKF